VWRRIAGVTTLRADVAEEVEADDAASGQAAALVGLAGALAGLGWLVHGHYAAFVAGIAWAYAGWITWSESNRFFGDRLFNGHASRGGMLRVTAFALAPTALVALPVVGPAGYGWALIAGAVAVARALRLTLTRALIVVVQGFVLYLAGVVLLQVLLR
jgi:hypothetical protein